jgi:hypothetical protein
MTEVVVGAQGGEPEEPWGKVDARNTHGSQC